MANCGRAGALDVLLCSIIMIIMFVSNPAQGGRPHISNLNVLLPPQTTIPVRYRLQGTDGCFLWTWDHHDIISLEAEYNSTSKDCSTSAVITAVAPFEERQATAVHATDIITDEVLRCEVFIDKISRIQIFHHSVKLDLDGWATLRIRAFDAEENVFSSLVGLRFMWQLSAVGPLGARRLLHVPLKDSPLSNCGCVGCVCGAINTQIELEENGFGSDLYVVRGISAGQETVKARLFEPSMEELEDILVLTVAEAISLEPHSPLYIIPGTIFQFRLRAMRQNVLKAIPLPSANHQWFSTDAAIVTVDRHIALIAARSVGVANVIVEDIRVKGHQQTATVHVVNPSSLELYLFPLFKKEASSRMQLDSKSSASSWYIVAGREYVVHVRAFSRESGTRALYLTENNDLRLLFSNLPFWDVVEVPEDIASDHGWQNATLLKALEEGSGALIAKLVYGEDPHIKVVKLEQSVIVCSPVVITAEHAESSRTVLLPWSPGSSQEYVLKAEGGCGDKSIDYVWSSSNPGVASVSALGKINSRGPGQTVIRASSAKDSLNADEIQIEVSVPSSITTVHGLPVEVQVHSNLPVAVNFVTPSGLSYSRCDGYNSLVQWELFGGDGNFKFIASSVPSTLADVTSQLLKPSQSSRAICAWNMVLPSRPGRATVTASLKVSTVETPTFLEESWTIAAYAPLALTQVDDGNCCGGYSCGAASKDSSSQSACQNLKELLLVVGSGIKVMLAGGPERWRQGSLFIEFLEVISAETGEKAPDDVSVLRTGDGGGRVFFITCLGCGNYTLVFERGYQETDGTVNIVASTRLSVFCGVPASIALIIDESDNARAKINSVLQLERDQERRRMIPVTVVNGRSIRVSAVALHNSGKPFANASSLALSWELEDCQELAYWEDDNRDLWERSLTLRTTVGLCAVRATLSSLRQSKLAVSTVAAVTTLLKQAGLFLTDAAQLQLVAALRLEPKETLLFSHPDAKAVLQVLGGTNDIESYVNDSRVAIVEQSPTGTRVSNLVVAARAKGTAMISILDVGLASPASATALVRVADIAWIKLTPDDLSLQLGTVVEIQVEVGDSSGRIFHPSQYVLFNIHVHLQDEVIGLVNQTSNLISANSFFIHGEDLGLSSFHVTAQQASGREIHSDLAKVEVYAPLLIQPSPLILAPGAQYMLLVHGGPRVGIAVEFSSSNPLIATVDPSSGLVIAKSVGNEVIYAKAHDHDGRLLGEASAEVTVSVPVSMFLEVRGGQLGVGREMSVFPSSNEGNLFSFFEMCAEYAWMVSDEEILQLQSVKPRSTDFSAQQYYEDESTWLVDTGFSARIIAKSAGRSTVSVSFLCYFHGRLAPTNYTASETVTVLPDPPLALGMLATLVLPPNHRSLDLLPQRAFDRLSSTSRAITYSLLHDGGGAVDLLSIDDGHVKTTDRIDVNCIHSRDRVSGRSEIAACIRVAEVSQMTVGDDDFPFHVAELSVGTQHSFTVTLRDNIGTPFFEVNLEELPLSIESNRADVVALKATSSSSRSVTVVVQALRQGKALVRISQKKKVDIADYILVFVGAYVHPRNPVMYIGDRLNFSIAGKGLHGAGISSLERGQWSSGNKHVVDVNSRTGEAEAISEGITVVSFNGSRLTAFTSIVVARVASVVVEAPRLQFLTNVPFPDQGYRFNVKFRNSQGHDIGMVGQNRVISYDCKVTPSIVGRAAPWHDVSSEAFYCMFFPYMPEKIAFDLQRELKKSKRPISDLGDSKGLVELTVSAVIVRTPDVVGSATCKFAGGFSIIETPPQLELSSSSNKSRIAVVGSVGAIAVSWQRKDAVNVKTLTKTEELGVGGHADYEVILLEEDKSFTDKLVFMLTTTGQREEIPIWYDSGSFYVADLSQQLLTVALITVVGVILPLFLCTKLLDLPGPFRSSAGSEARSPVVAQVIHDGSSGVMMNGGNVETPVQFRGFGNRSPPKPYTEYVSRTIEQTPYFSRQGVRRADPSRTY